MKYLSIDGNLFYNMVINASNKLEQDKEYVNSLNVFPVPDGDTGTNMSMTLKAAVCEIEHMKDDTIGNISKRLAKGALMGARGNSGVILSQIFRGIAKGLEDRVEANTEDVANSLMEGSNFAYKAVMRPTEGTILTIIRAAGECAINNNSIEDVLKLLEVVCKESEVVLSKTPDMLPQLKEAEVVDAGGTGLLIILKGMYEALKYNLQSEINKTGQSDTKKEANNLQSLQMDHKEIKYGYCTEFFVLSDNIDVEDFKKDLENYGDSMVVVGMEDIVKVHIHTNDPGFILSKALKLGELSKIKIDNMREQHRSILNLEEKQPQKEVKNKKYGFITVSRGEGIKSIFEDLGVDCVIEGGQTMNPSTQDILQSIQSVNAEHIFILPNNKNIIMAAKQAVEMTDKKVYVIPTKTIPQGITALTMFSTECDAEENIETMEEALSNVTTGSVTYAVKNTESDGKSIKEGDILGLVEENIEKVGTEIYEVCSEIIEKMVEEYSELITIYYGSDCEEEKVQELISSLEDKYPDIDIQSYNGKQPLYYFIVSVE